MRFLNKINIGLQSSLTLFILFPLVIFISIATYVGLLSLENKLKNYMQEDVELVARALKVPVAKAVKDKNFDAAKEIVVSVLDIDRLYGAYLYNDEGDLIFSAGVDHPQEKIPQPKNEKNSQGEYVHFKRKQVYSYVVPLTHKNLVKGDSGFLQVVRKKSNIYANIINFRYAALIIILAIISILLIIISVFYKYLILRPVNALKQGFEKVGTGNLKFALEPQSTHEFQFLLLSFNEMLEKLFSSRQESETRRKEKLNLEKKLQQTAKMAALGELSAGVAHELGTPLSAIDAKIQRSQRKQIQNQDVRPLLIELREETSKMTRIVEDLLNFSRPRPSISNELTNFNDCLEHSIDLVCELKQNVKKIIKLKPPKNLSAQIQTSHVHLQQALLNLIKNALEAVETQTKPQVLIHWFFENNTITCYIEDNGAGVSDELKQRVFEPFYTTKRPGAGTGLGLSVTHTLVIQMGGHIEFVDSSLGGTCCILRFPVVDVV